MGAEQRNDLNIALKLVSEYAWLLDAYVLDYFTQNHWSKLPKSWQNVLNETDPEELCYLFEDNVHVCKKVWPLSLLALKCCSMALSVPRNSKSQCKIIPPVSEGRMLRETQYPRKFINHLHSAYKTEQYMDLETSKCELNADHKSEIVSKITKVYMKGVKLKKQHEIKQMAQATAETATKLEVNYIVDVGSGVGHLSRLLAYKYGFRVCCIEAQSALSVQARKHDLEMEKLLSKYLKPEDAGKTYRPVHLNVTLDSQIKPDEFVQFPHLMESRNFFQSIKFLGNGFYAIKLKSPNTNNKVTLTKKLIECFNIKPEDLKFGIVGLHPCGDLAPVLLTIFADCSNSLFINIVGCCYMKLSLKSEGGKFKGYPMSTFVSQRNHVLSKEALEVACHAIENYLQRLSSGNYSNLKIHCYRAVLEKILVKYWPNLHHTAIKSIKHYSTLTFNDYCRAAVSKLGVNLSQSDMCSEETEANLAEWKKVVIIFTLRLLLAPLVETIVLQDRILFLQERGLGSELIPIFDPVISPRNQLLVGMKNITFHKRPTGCQNLRVLPLPLASSSLSSVLTFSKP